VGLSACRGAGFRRPSDMLAAQGSTTSAQHSAFEPIRRGCWTSRRSRLNVARTSSLGWACPRGPGPFCGQTPTDGNQQARNGYARWRAYQSRTGSPSSRSLVDRATTLQSPGAGHPHWAGELHLVAHAGAEQQATAIWPCCHCSHGALQPADHGACVDDTHAARSALRQPPATTVCGA